MIHSDWQETSTVLNSNQGTFYTKLLNYNNVTFKML